MTMRELEQAAKEILAYIQWDREAMEDFHAYAQRFGCPAGGNVFAFALDDALASRGYSLEQLRSLSDADTAIPAQPGGGNA